jgi:signal transduction histidine kinase
MNERIRQDYQNLKEFIENISHEIQNPLAIIKSRIDLLQQSETLSKSQANLIQSIQNSSIRLSNLNKSLILLSKIDNNQFSDKEEVDIVENINYHLGNFEDIIKAKKITLQINFGNQIKVMADPNLISIMLLNLLKNSIYHNLPSGNIEIITGLNMLTIRNTGKEPDVNPEDLFKRFTKLSNKPESLGLGLAIVKKICDYYNFTVHYTFSNNNHIISIIF